MGLYLVFHRNTVTGEDFTTPVEASSPYDAQQSLAARYPQPAYLYLTCFEKAELQSILDDSERWPGVASKPQPTLEQLLTRVTARVGKLPPLPGRAPAQQPSTQMAQATEASVKKAYGYGKGELTTPAKVAAYSQADATSAKKVSSKASMSTKPQTSLMAKANQGRSVIDVLRALKG